ncbi:hypothetical protein C8R46DRAFT_1297887 [Mycena filopes]|nr:hypothetical protein C8R46DRAFT_1297887 [Mycena filopes]
MSSSAPRGYSNLLAGTLNALCGILWTAAYVLYVRQARADESYGMPLFALVANISWEFVYTFVRPVHGIGRLFHFPWVFVDGLLLLETIKYGPSQWRDSSPLVADHFPLLVSLALLAALSAQWAFAQQFYDSNSCFWSAYFCQNVLSWGSLWMLISRGNPSGHSLLIWWCRFLGSLAANVRYVYRVHFWPAKYAFIDGAFSTWALWAPCIADMLYPAAYLLISRRLPFIE